MRNTWRRSIGNTKVFTLSMDCGQSMVEEEEIISHKAPDCVDHQIHLMYPVPPGFTKTCFIPATDDS
jgi:hypothetical protein